jgi:hypothetical protein
MMYLLIYGRAIASSSAVPKPRAKASYAVLREIIYNCNFNKPNLAPLAARRGRRRPTK